MSSVTAYSQVVDAVIHKAAWEETYFSLLSLKAHLQSLPGWQRFDFLAQEQENGDIKVLAITNWDYPEQLGLWMKQGKTVDAILRSMDPPPVSLNVNLYEEVI
ncbi:MAG: hypothetical protein KC615_00420 [Anaerolineae bacterium]|nr:hypothetical protein [Anaerolineae bacterium]